MTTDCEADMRLKLAENRRGTACHDRGTPCHETCNTMKTKGNKGRGTFTPFKAEKVIDFNGFKATGSLLRQVCRFLRGAGEFGLRTEIPSTLADAGGCLRQPKRKWCKGRVRALFLVSCPTPLPCRLIWSACALVALTPVTAPAETWRVSTSDQWVSGSSFAARTTTRREPGPQSSFAKAGAPQTFKLTGRRSAFVMPADRDEFVRLRALISHAESRQKGYDDFHAGARIPPPKPPSQMTIAEIQAWTKATPGQPHAIGRYQIIPSTLDSLVRRTGLRLDVVFNDRIQDALANVLILDAGYVELKSGQKPLSRFMDDLARIWAGFPLASGKSAYQGYAGNTATITRKFYAEQMAAIFPREAGGGPQAAGAKTGS